LVKKGCDSYYGVDKFFKNRWKLIKSLNELVDIVNLNKDTKRVIITGGEPLIYWNNAFFREFLLYLIKNDIHVTIETNGDLDVDFDILEFEKILFSISPKEEVDLKEYFFKNKDSYLKIIHNHPNISAKWIKECSKIIDIFIMPLGHDRVSLEKSRKSAFEFALENGYIFSDRDHINTFDKKKGI
jgi:7-carboxy-7-deazaguanine synthase